MRSHPIHAAAGTTTAPEGVMHLLEDHVPIALLCDLTTSEAPDSAEILAQEGVPADEWWVR
jgi:hypothetical protein